MERYYSYTPPRSLHTKIVRGKRSKDMKNNVTRYERTYYPRVKRNEVTDAKTLLNDMNDKRKKRSLTEIEGESPKMFFDHVVNEWMQEYL